MSRTATLVLILLAFGLFYTFTSSQWEILKDKQNLAADYQSVINNVASIADTRDKLLTNYNAIPKTQMDKLARALPDNVDTVNLAVDLNNIASRYGISIKNIKIESNVDNAQLLVLPQFAGPYEKTTISFGFIANYTNFMSFLKDLEKNLRIMDMRSASFKITETSLYEYQLTIDTYWLR